MEEMTREEIQAYIERAVEEYFQNAIFKGITPYFNLPNEIINQLINYSRN